MFIAVSTQNKQAVFWALSPLALTFYSNVAYIVDIIYLYFYVWFKLYHIDVSNITESLKSIRELSAYFLQDKYSMYSYATYWDHYIHFKFRQTPTKAPLWS